MTDLQRSKGTAALTILESLLLALGELKILPKSEILNLLRDASLAHEDKAQKLSQADLHASAATMINGTIAELSRAIA